MPDLAAATLASSPHIPASPAMQRYLDSAAARYEAAARLERRGDYFTASREMTCAATLLRQALAAPRVNSTLQQRLGRLLQHYDQCTQALQSKPTASMPWLSEVVGLADAPAAAPTLFSEPQRPAPQEIRMTVAPRTATGPYGAGVDAPNGGNSGFVTHERASDIPLG